MDKLYHSAKKRGGLQRPQNFGHFDPVYCINNQTNGENK